MKKGFVVSFDALIALAIFFLMLALSASYLGQVKFEAKNSALLKESAMDALTVLEKNHELENAVKNNSPAQLRQFLNKFPGTLCAELKIFSQNDTLTPKMSVLMPQCTKSPSEIAVFNRSFTVTNGFETDYYIARMSVWKKVK